jgi:hypothetical protein
MLSRFFVGCCARDPCDIICAQGNLTPGGFNPDGYGKVPDATCGTGAQVSEQVLGRVLILTIIVLQLHCWRYVALVSQFALFGRFFIFAPSSHHRRPETDRYRHLLGMLQNQSLRPGCMPRWSEWTSVTTHVRRIH